MTMTPYEKLTTSELVELLNDRGDSLSKAVAKRLTSLTFEVNELTEELIYNE